MGLGGDLIFTAIIREIDLAYPDKNIFLIEPRRLGRYSVKIDRILYKKLFSYNSSPVFFNNPHLSQGWVKSDSIIVNRKSTSLPNTLVLQKYAAEMAIRKARIHYLLGLPSPEATTLVAGVVLYLLITEFSNGQFRCCHIGQCRPG